MSLNEQYTEEMRERFGYSATWVPTSEVRLGDVGVLKGYQYERVCTLKDFGLEFMIRSDPGTGTLDYSSADSVSVVIKAAGEAPQEVSGTVDLKARIEVSFSRENAVFFQAADCTTTSIEDQHALAQALLKLYENGVWPEDYVVITEVIKAKRATVLISSGSNSMIEFVVSGAVEVGEHSLVDANAGIQVAHARNVATKIVAECELTPLFKAKGIKKRLLRTPIVDSRGAREAGAEMYKGGGAVVFAELDYHNFA